ERASAPGGPFRPARDALTPSTKSRQWPFSDCSVAVPAEGVRGCRAGAGPLRHGTAGRAPVGVPVRVRAPVPARAVRSATVGPEARPLGPALGSVLPCLAAAVGRHVEQAEGPVDPLVAAGGRGVGEEHAIAVAQVAGEVAHVA